MNLPQRNAYLAQRPVVLGLVKILVLALGQIPLASAAPIYISSLLFAPGDPVPKAPSDPSLWIYLGIAAALVLLGGAFAGLTIALMGQDEIYLQVIKTSGEGAEKKHAAKVLGLLNRGKHWVLVTLLLSNVITNETLPIILDRSLGGGWPAVLGSTVLIVIFGEIAPQSVCVRYGLPIGSWMAPFVLALMYILAPVAWPTAKLLDWLLGEDHGTVYKKAGLKTLVSLHKTMGETGQQLNSDEVTIISAVLDLKDKPVGSIMTPMSDVFTLSADDVLDVETMDMLLSQGYSRIPIHHPDNDQNFIGMLLVKMLITYDPEDAKPVRDFALATLPETRAETSCLDIVNFFQEGKSHMVLVSEHPGEDSGALGVVTLEDVIEELIGEEIIDESDVFVDVHKAIRRMAPAPRTRVPKGQVVAAETPLPNGHDNDLVDIAENETLSPQDLLRAKITDQELSTPDVPRLERRRSSATDAGKPKRGNNAEMREHLKHLGPSNLASRPKTTRYNTVKIKPGGTPEVTSGFRHEAGQATQNGAKTPPRQLSESAYQKGGIGEGLLTSAGKEASDGVVALAQGYGSITSSPKDRRPTSSASKGIQANPSGLPESPTNNGEVERSRGRSAQPNSNDQSSSSGSHSTLGSLRVGRGSPSFLKKGTTRSGSITENIVDSNGIRKVVLETTSSSSSNEDDSSGANQAGSHPESGENSQEGRKHSGKKKRRRKKKNGHWKGEQEPLLGGAR